MSDLLNETLNQNKDTNTQSSSNFNFDEAVRSPYGMSELNSYLYDSGLQNVFKDYTENIAILDKAEKQSLEDAYHTRELSKKYLGEYASNNEIGDVSGNLLDIYGAYQKNKSDIKQNFSTLEVNLNQEYRREKMTAFENKMKSQYNMSLADFEESSQEIMFNAVTGNYEGYEDGFNYLEAMMTSGELSGSDYRSAYASLYATTLDRIEVNLTSQNYEGFANAEEYINSFNVLNDSDKSMLQGIAGEIDTQNLRTDVINKLNTRDYGSIDGFAYLEQNRELLGEELYSQYYTQIYADTYQRSFEAEGFEPGVSDIDEFINNAIGNGLSTTDAQDLRTHLNGLVEQENERIALEEENQVLTDTLVQIENWLVPGEFDSNANTLEYLEENREMIGEEAYGNYKLQLYNLLKAEAYGGQDFIPGETDIDEYIEMYANKGLEGTDLDNLREHVTGFMETWEASQIDETVTNPESENYVGDDFNYNANFGGENVDASSYIYQDSEGNLFATIKDNAYSEQEAWTPNIEDLTTEYKDQNEINPMNGDTMISGAINETTGDSKDWTYVYQNGSWYRQVTNQGLEAGQPFTDDDMANWYFEETGTNKDDSVSGDNWNINDNIEVKKFVFDFMKKDKDGLDIFTYGNTEYTQSEKVYSGENSQEKSAIINKFNDIHGSKDNAVIFYDNKFFIRKGGKIYEMTTE